jgi:hypothetical protein
MTYLIQPEDQDWFNENLGLYSGKIDETACDFLPVKDFFGERRLVTVSPRGTPESGTDAGDDEPAPMPTRTVAPADDHRAAMDVLSILARVKSRLTSMETESADDAETLVIPLDGPSLANKLVASSFTRFCRSLTDGQREHLMFEVTGVDLTKDSMSLLDDTAIILFTYCSSYIIRVLPKNTNLRLVATNNYAGVSIDLRNKPWPVDVVRPHITAFVANAARNRLSTMVHGIATAPLLEVVEAAGARYVDGVALSQEAPSNGPGSG